MRVGKSRAQALRVGHFGRCRRGRDAGCSKSVLPNGMERSCSSSIMSESRPAIVSILPHHPLEDGVFAMDGKQSLWTKFLCYNGKNDIIPSATLDQ